MTTAAAPWQDTAELINLAAELTSEITNARERVAELEDLITEFADADRAWHNHTGLASIATARRLAAADLALLTEADNIRQEAGAA